MHTAFRLYCVALGLGIGVLGFVSCEAPGGPHPGLPGAPSPLTVHGGAIVPGAVPAVIDVRPKTINTETHGNYITVYIEFPDSPERRTAPIGPADIDVRTVTLQGIDPIISIQLLATGSPTAVGDGNANGVLDRMIKFDRATVQSWFAVDADADATFRIRGRSHHGTEFEGLEGGIRIIAGNSPGINVEIIIAR